MKQWQILQTFDKQTKSEKIIRFLLKNRGLIKKKEIENFLHPPRPAVFTSSDLGISKRELNRAIKRIKQAIDNQEKVIIYGDYDADGICATAILWEALDSLGARVMPFIPHRMKEGYGLSIKGIKKIQKKNPKVKLIITVDNGISAHQVIKYASKNKIDVIVTDHHLKEKTNPEALAIVHTTQISGAGVAWFLARELIAGVENSGLELAAIGAIGDIMPLIGINRSLVKYGLQKMSKTKRLGLLALFKETRIEKANLLPWQVSFIIAPRLNAAGRLGHAIDSLRLLCTRDPNRAKQLVHSLSQENSRRQRLTERTLTHAKKDFIDSCPNLLFAASPDYHEGVVGLIASGLVKKFYRPAIVFSIGSKISKGSARSIKGLNIIQAIRQCEKYLDACGGHPMAAGLTIKSNNLEKFRKCLTKVVDKKLKNKTLTPVLKIDCQLKLSHLTWKLYEKISKFGPFGSANHQPVFCSQGLRIVNMKAVGSNGSHLKIQLDDPATEKIESVPAFEGIGFGLGGLASQIKTNDLIDIAYTLEKNTWRDQETLQLKIRDLRLS